MMSFDNNGTAGTQVQWIISTVTQFQHMTHILHYTAMLQLQLSVLSCQCTAVAVVNVAADSVVNVAAVAVINEATF